MTNTTHAAFLLPLTKDQTAFTIEVYKLLSSDHVDLITLDEKNMDPTHSVGKKIALQIPSYKNGDRLLDF